MWCSFICKHKVIIIIIIIIINIRTLVRHSAKSRDEMSWSHITKGPRYTKIPADQAYHNSTRAGEIRWGEWGWRKCWNEIWARENGRIPEKILPPNLICLSYNLIILLLDWISLLFFKFVFYFFSRTPHGVTEKRTRDPSGGVRVLNCSTTEPPVRLVVAKKLVIILLRLNHLENYTNAVRFYTSLPNRNILNELLKTASGLNNFVAYSHL